MAHLVTLYSRFWGEMLHLQKNFPNSLSKCRHLNSLTQYHFPEGIPFVQKTNRILILLVFFCSTTIKKYIK